MRSALRLALFGALLALILVLLPGKQEGRGGSPAPTLPTAMGTRQVPIETRPGRATRSERETVRAARESASKETSAGGWIPIPPAWIPSARQEALVIGSVVDAEERPLAEVEVTCILWGDGLEWQHARSESDERGAFEMNVATGDVSRWVHALRSASLSPREADSDEPGTRTMSTDRARVWPTLSRVGMQIRARDPEGSVAVQHFSALPAAGSRTEVHLRIPAEPALEGAVVNALGFGVQGAWVALATADGALCGEPQRTGENGEFSVWPARGLPGAAIRQVELLAWDARLGQVRLPDVELPRAPDAARLELSLAGGPTPCPFEEQLPGVVVDAEQPDTTGDGLMAETASSFDAAQPGLWVHFERSATGSGASRADSSTQVELFLGRISEGSTAEPIDWSLQPASSPPGAGPFLPCCGGDIFSAPPLPAGRYRMQIRAGGVEGARREFDLASDRRVVVEFELAPESGPEER